MRFNIAIIWAIIIAILHAIPGPRVTDFSFTFFHLDKLIHIVLFMLGIYFFAIAYEEKQRKMFLIPLVISFVLYGGFLEIMQSVFFKNRFSDIYDWIADIIGVFIGIIFFHKFPKGLSLNYLKKD
mgnify:CR=1 FL=1